MPAVNAKPSLTLKRRFRAPADKVFEAWTRPEALKRWFGPSDAYTIRSAEVDLRVGGRYRIAATDPHGGTHNVGGEYREIVPSERLVFTWAWESTPERLSVVSISIKPTAEGCELTLVHEQFADEPARDRHQHGWTGSLDRLDRFLSA